MTASGICGPMDCFVASLLAMTIAGGPARNVSFTILVDLLFTTFVRRAFTNARDAIREAAAIA
ncbi:hypothetical protein QU42_28060 [Bradyrhizobium sp. UASWS1016]|nr:hypothetical protein QU42_28060 [Bradyrhizobium sp. UASWS1016]